MLGKADWGDCHHPGTGWASVIGWATREFHLFFCPDSLPHPTGRARGSERLSSAELPAGLHHNTKHINHRYYWPFSKHQMVQQTIPPASNLVLCLGCQNDTIWAVAVIPAYTTATERAALLLALSAHMASRAYTACRHPSTGRPTTGPFAAYTKLHAPQETRGSSTQQGRHQWNGSVSAATSIHAREPPLGAPVRQQHGRQHCPTRRISAPANQRVRAADPAECVSSTSAWSRASYGCATTSHIQLSAAPGNAAGLTGLHTTRSSASPSHCTQQQRKEIFSSIHYLENRSTQGTQPCTYSQSKWQSFAEPV